MKTFVAILVGIIVIGLIAAVVGFAMLDFNYEKLKDIFLKDKNFTEKNVDTDFEASSIIIDAENNIVKIAVSDDDKTHITYFESESYTFEYSEKDGAISLTSNFENKILRWFNFGYISERVRTITVEVPADFNGNLDINTSNGKITLEDLDNLTDVRLKTSNGKVTVKNSKTSGYLDVKSSNGELTFENLTVGGYLKGDTSNGRVNLNTIACVGEIDIDTSSGGISGGEISADKLFIKTSNGRITLNKLDTDYIDVYTSNGDIDLGVDNLTFSDYKFIVETTNGDIVIDGTEYGSQTINPSATNYLKARTSNGDIDIDF